MIEPRIYRAAFIPALLAIVLLAFSLEPPPPPLPQGLAADALFDGQQAMVALQQIVQAAPDRRPGTAGDTLTAMNAKSAFEAAGFPTTVDRFSSDGHNLTNVVASRPGESPREIVVMAARDARTVPDAVTSAADTAALLEFAHVFQGTAAHDTLVLASVDGGTLGDAGARRFAQQVGDPKLIDGVIVLSNLGADRSRGPLIVGWSNNPARESIGLARTASDSLRAETGQLPHAEPPLAQLARLAFPIAPGAQGALLTNGIEAVALSGSGELRATRQQTSDVDVGRYGDLGRAGLRIVSALDGSASAPQHGPSTYLLVSGQMMPGWAVMVLAVALMVPPFVAAVDALARARRRRERTGQWLIWLGAGTLPFLAAYLFARLVALLGIGPDAPPTPIDPAAASFTTGAIVVLALTVACAVLGWLLLRPLALRRAGVPRLPSIPGAACTTALIVAAIGLAVAFADPYAALVLAPLVNLWLLALAARLPVRASAALAVIGLAPPIALAAYYLWRFSLDPLHGGLYLALLVAGGQVGVIASLAACVLLGAGAALVVILIGRAKTETRAPEQRGAGTPPRPPIFGPGGYAGTGALGGTRSTMRR